MYFAEEMRSKGNFYIQTADLFATKTVAMHNFIDKVEWKETPKKYAPFLMISVVFGALVQLLGGIFSAAKESKAFGNTILIGAAANTVMNVVFVYACGPLGAAIAKQGQQLHSSMLCLQLL